MLKLSVAQIAQSVGGQLHYATQPESIVCQGISTDTRHLPAGALFVALHGPNFDGHDFLAAAQQQAAAALVTHPQPLDLAQIVVPDTLVALGRLAAGWRQRFAGQVIALTGSNGKTTVKEMLASILAAAPSATVLATQGNLNNHIGVPLTLSQLGGQDYAVIEMGANHSGEIATLTRLAQPQVALITNAGPAHLEGFGSLEGVARAKGEIYQGLLPNGIAVINADDRYADYWRELNAQRRCLTFGLQPSAQVWAEVLAPQCLRLHIAHQSTEIRLPLPGRHNVLNALAAAAAAHALGVDLTQIQTGLQHIQPVAGRLQCCTGPRGSVLLNDTYNANPASLQAGLAALLEYPGPHWLVLGDMAELGVEAEALHALVGQQAREQGIQRLFTLGVLSQAASRAFGSNGQHYLTLQPLLTALQQAVQHSKLAPYILIKGSRSMRMERVVEALSAQEHH
jgi:UDP-N-acetylmuramoyl-tripeptide--D-alanyl-D-alanine ligase